MAQVATKTQPGRLTAKEQIIRDFDLFLIGGSGIGSWLSTATDEVVFERLSRLEAEPLSLVQFRQLLVWGHQGPPTDDFLEYYWLTIPENHPYPAQTLSPFNPDWVAGDTIKSLQHLEWGLRQLYSDSLMWWGNIREGYRQLRQMSGTQLKSFFAVRRYDTDAIRRRGPSIPLEVIPKDNRYLISEMACKSYGATPRSEGELERALLKAFEAHEAAGGGKITVRKLIDGTSKTGYVERQQEFLFAADAVLDDQVSTKQDLQKKIGKIASTFFNARTKALANTRNYLSMVGDLDVYVATSMRNREDFRRMAERTEQIFGDPRLKELNIRYFDPTLSAAQGHEDKGLIECLMVKCSKVLVYCAGEKESYGKDAEAAMALSLGKPVIFLCDHEQKSRFYREVHPLSRLIDFSTGVAVGAIVTDDVNQVSELLYRIFSNTMEYDLEKKETGCLRLKERLTGSVVRLQTNDALLSETFWNHYHGPVRSGT